MVPPEPEISHTMEKKIKQRFLCFLLFLILPVFSVAKQKTKVLPAYLQKAYVIQKNAIVYTRPSFDSVRISHIPAGTLVTVSRKIYRPENRFGTFYRIYITKPKKLRAYISEIDVIPRYVKSGSRFKGNPEFRRVKKKLHHIKDFQFNSDTPEDVLDLSDQSILNMRLMGLIVSHKWLAYDSKSDSVPAWFFGLKLSGPGLPIKKTATDINLMFSLSPPFMDGRELKKGYTVLGDFLLKLPLLEGPHLAFHAGGGFMVKLKGSMAPEKPTRTEIGGGVACAGALTVRVHDRVAVLAEGKLYYDLLENNFVPGIVGGILISF